MPRSPAARLVYDEKVGDGSGRLRLPRWEVSVGGVDITHAVTGVGLRARAGDWAVVTLELFVQVVEVGGVERIEVEPAVAEALRALGWTPPGEVPSGA